MPTTIHEGSSGTAVMLAQYELCRDLYLSGPDDVDGAFGPHTGQAVRHYQSDHGLVTDGTVGPATWATMLGDLVSLELASARGVDPLPVEAIERFKEAMGPV